MLVLDILLAAVGGLCCVVLPPYLIHGGLANKAYGWPVITWFALAFANLRYLHSMIALFVLGALLGLMRPRQWWLLGCLTISLPCVFNSINMIHDCNVNPTSHNLWPFEFAFLMSMGIPPFAGAFLGSRLRRLKKDSDNTMHADLKKQS
jgi:hypothetical protein